MLNIRLWSRIVLIMVLILSGLITGIGRTSGQSPTYTFSGHLEFNLPIYNTVAHYSIPATAGDVLDIDFNYQAANRCIWSTLTLRGGSRSGFWRLITFSQPLQTVVTGNIEVTYLVEQNGDVPFEISILCWASHQLYPTLTVNYTLNISVENPSVPPTPPDPIIAAEEAAGLQRVQDNSLPVVIYTPTAANPDRFIDIRDLVGNPLLYISADELAALPDFPDENMLIASEGLVSVYKLTTGEYQVNVGPLPDGKVHVIIFDGIPRTHTYGYTWDLTNPIP